ncbi:MAG: hypothetical protein GWO24_28375, partial [Akkermansiaceae bacterium]|nr:hypothetical protein [Akkermansiaceae bacterium]
PPGEKFRNLLALNDGDIFATLQTGNPTSIKHTIYEEDANGMHFPLHAGVEATVFSGYPALATVKLF